MGEANWKCYLRTLGSGLATGRVGKCVKMARVLLINKLMQLDTVVALVRSCEQLTW
jgi:hypothetical protein